MTSSKFNHLPKASSSNSITLEFRASIYGRGRTQLSPQQISQAIKGRTAVKNKTEIVLKRVMFASLSRYLYNPANKMILCLYLYGLPHVKNNKDVEVNLTSSSNPIFLFRLFIMNSF